MDIKIQDLMEAGAHFGHQTSQRHPAFAPFVFEERKGVHIINSAHTMLQLENATDFLRDITAKGGRVLFVGTKAQAATILQEEAVRCGQFYVTFRWLGGFLTNFKTIRNSIKKMIAYEENEGRSDGLAITKKERMMLRVEYEKLSRVLAGVREMRKAPDAVVVIDTGIEAIAVRECAVRGVPVIGIVDSNSNPTLVSHPVPGNDDSVRAIALYARVLADAIIEGQALFNASGPQEGKANTETEFVLDKEEDLDEAALLARRKVYKVKKNVDLKEGEIEATPEVAAEEAPVEAAPSEAAPVEAAPVEAAPAEDAPAETAKEEVVAEKAAE